MLGLHHKLSSSALWPAGQSERKFLPALSQLSENELRADDQYSLQSSLTGYLANCLLVRSDPQEEPDAAVSLLLLAPAQDIVLICKVPVYAGFLIIIPEGVLIKL